MNLFHTEKSRLDLYHFGDTKVKIEITLDNDPPKLVEVRDVQGNAARIRVEYPSLPPKCINCEKYGHLINRCLQPIVKKKKEVAKGGSSQERMVSTSTNFNLQTGLVSDEEQVVEVPELSVPPEESAKKKKSKRRGRSRSRAKSASADIRPHPSLQKDAGMLITRDTENDKDKEGNLLEDYGISSQLEGKMDKKEADPSKRGDDTLSSEVLEEEEISEPASPDCYDHEEDERLWFKHPKAIRKAVRQKMWQESISKQSPRKSSLLRTWGSSSGQSFTSNRKTVFKTCIYEDFFLER